MKKEKKRCYIVDFGDENPYKNLWYAVILQSVFDLKSDCYADDARRFLNSFDFGRKILKEIEKHGE